MNNYFGNPHSFIQLFSKYWFLVGDTKHDAEFNQEIRESHSYKEQGLKTLSEINVGRIITKVITVENSVEAEFDYVRCDLCDHYNNQHWHCPKE